MTSDEQDDFGAFELRSFGRRRGRKFSGRQDRLMQELLPKLALDLGRPIDRTALQALFQPSVEDIWLEIGFGGGEHLLWQAMHKPGIGLIGAEPFEDGVVKVLAGIEDHGLANIRLHAEDARDLLRWLPAASIGRAFILFPDPWPKRRHAKRRLVNGHLLSMLAQVLKPGAELRIATDIGDYARTILMAFQSSAAFRWDARRAADWREKPEDWPATRYGEKAIREGRRSAYLRFTRV